MKIYFVLATAALVGGAYFFGVLSGRTQCESKYENKHILTIKEINKAKWGINEKVFNTGVADIRSILREKYTIND